MLEHRCEVCGRLCRKKLKADGKVVCNKHYRQFKKFGKFTDFTSRTQYDRNEIEIVGDIAYVNLYDAKFNVIDKAIIDREDVPLVKYIKWRRNVNGYAINGSSRKRPKVIFMHRLVLNCDTFVDHINGNRLDNRKCNLRMVTKSQNQMNVNYRGIYPKLNSWIAKIKLNQKQLHLGVFPFEEEALYARWFAERIVFKEFAFPKPEPDILESRKEEIQQLVKSKVQRLQ